MGEAPFSGVAAKTLVLVNVGKNVLALEIAASHLETLT